MTSDEIYEAYKAQLIHAGPSTKLPEPYLLILHEIAYQLALMNERDSYRHEQELRHIAEQHIRLARTESGKRDAEAGAGIDLRTGKLWTFHNFAGTDRGIRCMNCGKWQKDCAANEVCTPRFNPDAEPGKTDTDGERAVVCGEDSPVEHRLCADGTHVSWPICLKHEPCTHCGKPTADHRPFGPDIIADYTPPIYRPEFWHAFVQATHIETGRKVSYCGQCGAGCLHAIHQRAYPERP